MIPLLSRRSVARRQCDRVTGDYQAEAASARPFDDDAVAHRAVAPARPTLHFALTAVLLILTGLSRSLAQDSCSPNLIAPAVDISFGFPQAFSWAGTDTCPSAQLAFATGTLPDIAYVFETIASPTVVAAADWASIKEALDPDGTTNEFYWTLVDADSISFLEL